MARGLVGLDPPYVYWRLEATPGSEESARRADLPIGSRLGEAICLWGSGGVSEFCFVFGCSVYECACDAVEVEAEGVGGVEVVLSYIGIFGVNDFELGVFVEVDFGAYEWVVVVVEVSDFTDYGAAWFFGVPAGDDCSGGVGELDNGAGGVGGDDGVEPEEDYGVYAIGVGGA